MKRIAQLITFVALTFCWLTPGHGQQTESKKQADGKNDAVISPLVTTDYIGARENSLFQIPLTSASNECPVRKGDPPATCECGANHEKRNAQCYSCYKPGGGQKCGGPYCESCTVVCNPAGAHPAAPIC